MIDSKIPVVILAGGKGLRIRDYSDSIPKALVPIGGLAIVEHIIKVYQHYGLKDFIICAGYLGDKIKEHFAGKDEHIIIVDTGLETPGGGRIKKIMPYIKTDNFMVTYCDGLSDVNLDELYDFHISKNKIATLTAVHPMSQFGVLEIDDGIVKSFKEKPALPGYVSGGFFVFNKKIFDYLSENSTLEEEPIMELVRDGQMSAYCHEGFWTCMDTSKDVDRLNGLWQTGIMPNTDFKAEKPPWKIWDD